MLISILYMIVHWAAVKKQIKNRLMLIMNILIMFKDKRLTIYSLEYEFCEEFMCQMLSRVKLLGLVFKKYHKKEFGKHAF